MADIAMQAVQVQIAAFIESWQQEIAPLRVKARQRGVIMGYDDGYADALDRCVQALRLLKDAGP